MSTPPAACDWADLPSDVLGSIARKASAIAVDSIRFPAVCKPWCSAASPANGVPTRLCLLKKPYLLLRSQDDTELLLLDVFPSSVGPCCQRLDPLPELVRGEKQRIVGSQFGWIAVLDKFANPSLVNPLTRAQIHLPPVTTLSELVQPIYKPDDGSLWGYRHYYGVYRDFVSSSLEKFRDFGILKLALSCSPSDGDFSALALFGDIPTQLIYIRPGDTTWSVVKDVGDEFEFFTDVIFHDGRFLVVSNPGDLYAVDVGGPVVQLKNLVSREGGPPLDWFESRGLFEASEDLRFLVESCGVLMQVIQMRHEDDRQIMTKTRDMVVMRLDLEAGRWIPVDDLGDQSFFLGTSYSMSISPKDIPGLKENCIYFADGDLNYYYSREEWIDSCSGGTPQSWMMEFLMIPDNGIYNMKDMSVEAIHAPDERFNWRPPTWFIPSAK